MGDYIVYIVILRKWNSVLLRYEAPTLHQQILMFQGNIVSSSLRGPKETFWLLKMRKLFASKSWDLIVR